MRRSYDSYLARVETAKRLRALGNWWNGAAFSIGAALISISIAFLKLSNSQRLQFFPGGEVALTVLTVLTLVVSIVVANLDYSARAAKVFANYRLLQAFSVEVELLINTGAWVGKRRLAALSDRHQQLLDDAENHSRADYLRSKSAGGWGSLSVGMVFSSTISYALPFIMVAGSALTVIWVLSRLAGFQID
jgi:SMODS and SLOG-associating 2TM effector domain family 5